MGGTQQYQHVWDDMSGFNIWQPSRTRGARRSMHVEVLENIKLGRVGSTRIKLLHMIRPMNKISQNNIM